MPRILDLLGVHGNIWFYIGTEENLKRQFMEEAMAMDCRFNNGKEPKVTSCGNVMAIHRDLTIAYVSLMIWDISFSPSKFHRIKLDGPDTCQELKVDYQAFTTGEERFVYVKAYNSMASLGRNQGLITLEEGLRELAETSQ